MRPQRLQVCGLVGLGLMIAVGMLVSPDLRCSLVAAVPLLLGLLIYLVLSFVPTATQRPIWILWGILGGTVVFSLLTPFGMLPPKHALFRLSSILRELQRRFPGTLNANVVSGGLVMLLPFALAALLAARPQGLQDWGLTLLAVGALLFGAAVLYLTHSQAAMLAVAVEIAVFSLLRWPRVAHWAVPPLLVLGLAAGATTGWRTVLDSLVGSGTMGKFDGRLEIWVRALTMIGDYPLTGVGLGCFEPVGREIYPLFLLPGAAVTSAHNLVLQVAVDLGVPGLLAYLLLLGHAFWAGLEDWRRRRSWAPYELVLVTACLAALSGMWVHGLLDAAEWANKTAFLQWMVMGLCVAFGAGRRRRPPMGAFSPGARGVLPL